MKNILFLILCGGMVACGAPTETPKKEEKKVAPTPVVGYALLDAPNGQDGRWLGLSVPRPEDKRL